MLFKVGINGFGCIGCFVFRVVLDKGVDVVVVNDFFIDFDYMVYMFKYDLIYGVFNGEIKIDGGKLVINGKVMFVYCEWDLVNIFWFKDGVEYIVDFIGCFIIFDKVGFYMKGGVKKVIIFVFLVDVFMFVCGVNEEKYFKDQNIVSNVFCIINCFVFFVKVINEKFGIVEGLMIIVYAYIVIQKVVDGLSNKDWRGGRGVV